MEEIWKPVVGYEGLYEVSSLGRVRSLEWGRMCNTTLLESGYVTVSLRKNKIKKTGIVHRLVGFAFLGLTSEKVIDHINGNRSDNSLANLRVCTQRENTSFGNVRRSKTSKYIGVCWHERDCKWMASIRVNKRTAFLGYFDSQEEAAEAYRTALHVFNTTGIEPPRQTATNIWRDVSFDKSRNRWRVFIKVRGKKIYVGQFREASEAEEAFQLKRAEVATGG